MLSHFLLKTGIHHQNSGVPESRHFYMDPNIRFAGSSPRAGFFREVL
jgi:hypothetical protein